MNKFEYHLVENELTAKDFIRLKVATGFMDSSIEPVIRLYQGEYGTGNDCECWSDCGGR